MTPRTLLMAVLILSLACSKEKSTTPAEGAAPAAQSKSGGEAKGGPAPEPAHKEGEEHDEGEEGHADGEEHGEGEAGHEELITLTPEALKAAQLQLGKAQAKPLARSLTVAARITFTQKGVAKVAARVPGRLASIEVSLGQKVKKGEVLGYLESTELGQARADYFAAATKARVAGENFQREKELLEKGITSAREMRQAESEAVAAQADRNAADGRLHALGLSDADIAALKADAHSSRFAARAPIAGTVVEVAGTVGQTVEPTAPLFTVADLSELWVLLHVFEAQLPGLKEGQPVSLTVSALPGQRFNGRVDHIGDIVDEKTRSVSVRVAVPNTDGRLKPGMFAQAEIATTAAAEEEGEEARAPRLVVPREAVQKVGEEQVVFVPAGPGKFRPVEVRLGESSAQEVEVVSGLEPGAELVTRGAFVLKSELSKESMGEGHSH